MCRWGWGLSGGDVVWFFICWDSFVVIVYVCILWCVDFCYWFLSGLRLFYFGVKIYVVKFEMYWGVVIYKFEIDNSILEFC